MTDDPNRPKVLLAVSSEVEAAAIVTALEPHEIEAITVGGYTSGFKAEAPGTVAVVVKMADFDRAKQALAEIREQQGEVDWSKVDVMETAEEPANAEYANNVEPEPSGILYRTWWMVELLGIAICLIIWLFTRKLTPLLVCTAAALAVIGIFLAIAPQAIRRY
jgi:hypothetical protein